MAFKVVQVRLLTCMLMLWSIAGVGLIMTLDTADTRWLGSSLAALIPIAAITRPVPRAGIIAAVVAAVVYGGAQIARSIGGANAIPQLFLGIFVFALMVLLAEALSHMLLRLGVEIARDHDVIEELSMRDETTGAIKLQHANRMLIEEIERSRRYNRALSLVLVGVANWNDITEGRDEAERRELLAKLGAMLGEVVRTVDKVAYHGGCEFSLILPETPLQGAQVVAQKVATLGRERFTWEMRAGIAEFPTDAVTSEDLLKEAEAALAFAQASELRVAARSLLE
ncbi:MAG: diguanylate cyclase [Chloroflexi bacterium]|nr:diguanylate cyclase [Chloroflexota bacterium]